MTDADKLRQAGEALYGPRWQTALAKDLGVASRSVRYWAAGKHDPPAGVWGELHTLLKGRRRLIDDVLTNI